MMKQLRNIGSRLHSVGQCFVGWTKNGGNPTTRKALLFIAVFISLRVLFHVHTEIRCTSEALATSPRRHFNATSTKGEYNFWFRRARGRINNDDVTCCFFL